MSELIISVSGLRGIVGESLTPQVAIDYACAFAQELPPGAIVIGRDGRASGPPLVQLIQGGLRALGRTCLDAGVAATPTVGVLVRVHQAAGGIQISASHNPASYNGLKLFSAQGRVISAAEGRGVIDRYQRGAFRWASHDRLGDCAVLKDTVQAHWDLVRGTVDVERIRSRHYKVLLDANHGAGSVLGRYLLEQLGCHVRVLGEVPDGQFEHPAEPTAESLVGVAELVRQGDFDVCFCQDPDADRLAIIDHRGRYLGEEYTLALCVDHVLRQAVGPIVTNCSTSRMAQDLAAKYGAAYYRSPVGEANVVEVMLAHRARLGGEGNGGVIDPRVGLVRDSLAGMALVLDAMAGRAMPVAALADELPRYAICKTKFPLADDKLAPALDALERRFNQAEADRSDGLRLDWPDCWLLVRPSNTEPIVRAIAEAPTMAEAQSLCEEAGRIVCAL